MKKASGKPKFGKKQIVTSVLVLILAAAIYINWQYSDMGIGTTKDEDHTECHGRDHDPSALFRSKP